MRKMLAVLVVFAVGVTACGGDDDGDGFAADPTSEAIATDAASDFEADSGSSGDGEADVSDSADVVEADGGSGALAVMIFEQAGFEPEQAACLADALDIAAMLDDSSSSPDPADIMGALGDCDVSPEDFAKLVPGDLAGLGGDGDPAGGPGAGVELDDLPPQVGDAITEGLLEQGFTRNEAECLATEMFASGSANPLEAFGECDIDLGRLAELGG